MNDNEKKNDDGFVNEMGASSSSLLVASDGYGSMSLGNLKAKYTYFI